MKLIVTAVIAMTMADFAFAQGHKVTVKARVVDAVTHTPLKNAWVVANRTNKGVLTNDDGVFELLVDQDLSEIGRASCRERV